GCRAGRSGGCTPTTSPPSPPTRWCSRSGRPRTRPRSCRSTCSTSSTWACRRGSCETSTSWPPTAPPTASTTCSSARRPCRSPGRSARRWPPRRRSEMAAIVPPCTVACGRQLPIHAQSTLFVEPWEADATTDVLVAVARAAGRAGALYVGVCEHVAIPNPHDESMGTTWYHPFTTLGFLAGATRSVRLLSHVIALPYHH